MTDPLPIPAFLVDWTRFLLRVLRNPRNVGAVAPSSRALARAMAVQIPSGPVLELGPGTGVITEAILERGIAPRDLTLVEYDPDFVVLLRARFPGVTVIRGDAFDLAKTLGRTAPFGAIVSGLPLLNFPREARARLLEEIFARLKSDAPFVQFSYGVKPPVPAPEGASVTRAAFIPFNIPPARVWVYRKEA